MWSTRMAKYWRKVSILNQGSTDRQVKGSTGLNWSEIFKILLLLVRSEIFTFLVVLVWVEPVFLKIFWPSPRFLKFCRSQDRTELLDPGLVLDFSSFVGPSTWPHRLVLDQSALVRESLILTKHWNYKFVILVRFRHKKKVPKKQWPVCLLKD